jgi:hypothetical protein
MAIGVAEELVGESNLGKASMFAVDHPEVVRVKFLAVGEAEHDVPGGRSRWLSN